MQIRSLRAVLLDLDGTLIDSVPVYFKLAERMLEAVRLPPVDRSVVAELMKGGKGAWENLVPETLRHEKEHWIAELMAVGKRLAQELLPREVKLVPGVEALFEFLEQRRIKIGLVTSTHTRYLERKLAPLAACGLTEKIQAVVAIEDAAKIKPAPDPLFECARRLNTPAAQCIYVGDSHVDLRAGNAAGMVTVGVLTGLDDYDTLALEKPFRIVENAGAVQDILTVGEGAGGMR